VKARRTDEGKGHKHDYPAALRAIRQLEMKLNRRLWDGFYPYICESLEQKVSGMTLPLAYGEMCF
jgi:hypothetical protein